jgi:hypothetical protein
VTYPAADDRIVVSAGGPPPDQDIPDGVYPLILSDIKPPRTVTAKRGPKAGQDIDLRDWIFDVDQPGHPLDGRVIDVSTSLASGPKSKQFEILTALFNGVRPPEGTSFGKSDLCGRRILGTIQHDEGGWPQIATFSAMPAQMQQQAFAAATGAPVAAAPVPVAALAPAPQPAVPSPAPAPESVPAAAPVSTDQLPF